MDITPIAVGPPLAPSANGASGSITSPGSADGVQVDDLLILHMAGSITAPPTLSGVTWTQLEPNLSIGSPGPFHSTWYKWADSADLAGSVTTATIGNSTNIMVGYIAAFRGVDTSTIKDVATPAGAQSATATLATPPSITTATPDALVVMLAAELGASGSTTNDWSSTNMIERSDAKTTRTGSNPHIGLFTAKMATPGSFSPNLALAAGTSGRSSVLTIALKPAGDPPPPLDPLVQTPWDQTPGSVTTLARGEAYLDELAAATNRVRVITLGSSAQGRTIRAAIVGPPRSRDQIRAANTALIIGSIHGDEWAGREAIFELMRSHAVGTGTDTLVFIPTLNPDGFSAPQRNLANGSDPNRLWSQSGIDQQTTGGAYFPEQQCLRQAILLYRPKAIFDTHEYTSSGTTYRFDPGTTNATGTPSAVITVDQAILSEMVSAAQAAGFTTSNYGGAIPDDGMTQAMKWGGIPAVFTESPQESSLGITGRRSMHLSSLNAFKTYVEGNASSLATIASSATWYSGYSPTVSDAFSVAVEYTATLAASAAASASFGAVLSRPAALSAASTGSLVVQGVSQSNSQGSWVGAALVALAVSGSRSTSAVLAPSAAPRATIGGLVASSGVLAVRGTPAAILGALRTAVGALPVGAVPAVAIAVAGVAVVTARATPVLTIAGRQGYFRVLAVRAVPGASFAVVIVGQVIMYKAVRSVLFDDGIRLALLVPGASIAELLGNGRGVAVIKRGS